MAEFGHIMFDKAAALEDLLFANSPAPVAVERI
jgi:hypothetical protein